MGSTLHEAPAVVIAAKACGGAVAGVAGVDNGTELIQRIPFPGELYIGNGALLGDAGDGNQLAFGGGNAEGLFFGVTGSDETLKRIHAGGCECDDPARGRSQSRRAGSDGGGNPAVVLEHEVVGRKVILV